MNLMLRHPATGLPIRPGVWNVAGSALLLAVIGFLLALAISPRPSETVAHLYGRVLGPGQESACPTTFGNAFWFACASETRR